jgi:hypothetical protein
MHRQVEGWLRLAEGKEQVADAKEKFQKQGNGIYEF